LLFPEGYSLDSIIFSSYEAVYVYLACKLITDTLDRHRPYAASAIRKLGVSSSFRNFRTGGDVPLDPELGCGCENSGIGVSAGTVYNPDFNYG